MSLSKERREEIESTIINMIGASFFGFGTQIIQKNIAALHNVSAQTISRFVKKMEQSGRILKQTLGHINIYTLPQKTETFSYQITGLNEDKVYRDHVAKFIQDVPKTAKSNYEYAFLEILNNAIEHSNGTTVTITIKRNECVLSFAIVDDGVGVFTKIAETLGLDEKRYAILELAKGKFTSDPGSHSGEGIFFSSKCGDGFTLESDGITFNVGPSAEELLETTKEPASTLKSSGTCAILKIYANHEQTLEELFKQYSDAPERYGFSKTAIPIRLLEFGDESPIFISRSQARRLLVRVERFEVVRLDFSGVDSIGQGFADEIFRVFKTKHPEVELIPVNCNEAVNQMIRHVLEYR